MKIINSTQVGRGEIERLLTKKSFDEPETTTKIFAANKIFSAQSPRLNDAKNFSEATR